jgi:hypothetical protein
LDKENKLIKIKLKGVDHVINLLEFKNLTLEFVCLKFQIFVFLQK